MIKSQPPEIKIVMQHSDEHGGMERLNNFLKGTQLVNGQAAFKPDSIASEIQFFNIISIPYLTCT